ncbi:multidrug effflux MFS transporter [Vibrio fluvialis]|uniref:multidrug effflux MFS transporter n=1 Tax=Vibrio fluvialis TaxID=676 RepID=UPI001EECB919|nr:multidrug effflux MFS transporter [Vibrio fluvialis]MCG6409652.1 multidrug effflux MFS transporter [Vibrio fluvialis]
MNREAQDSFKKTPMLLAMMIIATGQVGVAIYLPSLPMISQDLQVDQASVQMLVTLFLLGFGGSQLFYGALSDAVGRRPTFILGQGIYLLGTILCVAFSDSFSSLEMGRLLQGLGAGSASVLGRSVLRDSYDGHHLTKAMSYIAITASIMPIVAPVVGGWMTYHFSWQAVFIFVMVYISAIFTLGYFILPETLPYAKKRFEPSKVAKNYWALLRNWQVLSSASYNWISYLSSLVTLSVLPFLLQKQLGMTAAQYGSIMIIPSAGLLVGSVLVNIFHRRFSSRQLLGTAIGIMIFAGVWLLITPFNVFNLVWAFTWLTVAQGISFPLSTTLLLSPHKTQAGSVSALSGSIQMLIAGLLGGFLVEHCVTQQSSLGWFYLATSSSMLFVLMLSVSQPETSTQPST